nr:MAG TPA: hypothetical protein [Bacteriophage sp.]
MCGKIVECIFCIFAFFTSAKLFIKKRFIRILFHNSSPLPTYSAILRLKSTFSPEKFL